MGGDRVLQHDQAVAVREQRLELDSSHQLRHVLEDVARLEDLVPVLLDGLVPEPVPRGLHHLVRDQRNGLGLAEQQPARPAAAGQLGREEDLEPVLFAGQQSHGRPFSAPR